MAGLSDVTECDSYYAQNELLSSEELFEDTDELPVLHIEEQDVESLEADGQIEHIFELNRQNESKKTEAYCQTVTQHSRAATGQTESYESNGLKSNPDNSLYKNRAFKFSNDVRDIFTCHTSTMEKVYHSWHTCCNPDPNRHVRRSLEEDFFDDCLNYLECSDVMTTYTNGIWQQVLQGNDPVFLLESDQDNESSETKVSQDLLNGCDPLQGGVSCLREESNDTVVLDASTGLCDSHSESAEEAVKRELPRDGLKALQPEMVITVGHQQDEMSSVRSKERCKVASAAAAIQDDRAGIEEENKENSQRSDLSTSVKTSNNNAFVKLFPKNELDKKDLNVMKDEPMEIPLILACSREMLEDGELKSLEDKLPFIDEECQCQKDELKNIHERPDNDSTTVSFQAVNEENNTLIQEGTSGRPEEMDTKYECTMECAGRTSEGEETCPGSTALTEAQHPVPNNLSSKSTHQLSGQNQRKENDFCTSPLEYRPTDTIVTENEQNVENSVETTVNELDKEPAKMTICSSSNATNIPTNLHVVNDKDMCLFKTNQAKCPELDNRTMFVDDNKRTIDTKSNGRQTHGSLSKHDSHSKNKSRSLPSRSNSCILKKETEQVKNDKVKELIPKEAAASVCNSFESKSKGMKGSPNATDYIPKSQELILVCSISDTIKENGFTAVASLLNDTQLPATGSSATEGKKPSRVTENKAAKKKLKTHGKELDKISKSIERQASVVTSELITEDDEQREGRECVIEAVTLKDNKKAPQLLYTIQAEMFPDSSGNLKLHCCFGEIHADSTVTWMKDSKLLARLHRSANDVSPISLAISQISPKDQGLYQCSLKNMYGKASAELHLTSEVLEQLSRSQDIEGGEEIEFNQLLFREDFITDMYFGGNLHGRIVTEDLHFGEGVHRKAFRSKVMCGLLPVFNPGHLCVLKVHNAIAYGTKTIDELVQRNYKLAVQECYVQNTAREYAKIYAAEAEQLEEFGKVPEIIPIFLIHRPANNIPYATVEEELIGDFVKYSVRDGKEINVLRRDSEAGQKCCTFQHWVYEKTNGNLLVTDMQGVGMKLTDVGIATIAKGYKGFKGNCSGSFIDQFKVLHQCNKYCEILGLHSLRATQKQKKPSPAKEKSQPNPPSSKKTKHGTKPKNKT